MFRKSLNQARKITELGVRQLAPKVKGTKIGASMCTTTSSSTSNNEMTEMTEMSNMFKFSNVVHPKVKLYGLHARYANALYSVSAKEKGLESVEKELAIIKSCIDSNENFADFLKNPTIARHQKKNEIMSFIEEGQFSKPVAGLFSILADNGRLPETYGIISTYEKLMSAYRGEVKACVTSADPLTESELKEVEKAVKNHLKEGETLVLETAVNPELLGGLQVKIGLMFIDLSIAYKINKIHELLSDPV